MGGVTNRVTTAIHRPGTATPRPFMPKSSHNLAEGDRVRAARRPEFPDGTVLRLMDLGYLLIRWDSDVLETAHHSELTKLSREGP
jgi:hypothetical protein